MAGSTTSLRTAIAAHPAVRSLPVRTVWNPTTDLLNAASGPAIKPLLALLVILAVIPQATTEPNQTALTSIIAQPDLARPYWSVKTRRLAVIS